MRGEDERFVKEELAGAPLSDSQKKGDPDSMEGNVMEERIEKMQQEVAYIDEKLLRTEQKEKQLQARCRKKENEIKYKNRKQRTHRLIEIGAEVESILGRQIPKEDLPAFREYMKRAEKELGTFVVVDGRCSFLLP